MKKKLKKLIEKYLRPRTYEKKRIRKIFYRKACAWYEHGLDSGNDELARCAKDFINESLHL